LALKKIIFFPTKVLKISLSIPKGQNAKRKKDSSAKHPLLLEEKKEKQNKSNCHFCKVNAHSESELTIAQVA
jgi:hypothetical protein